MRLIDADALDIDNLNRAYDDNFELDFGRLYTADVIDMIANASTINAIPIPEDATNGDVITTMFSDAEYDYHEKNELVDAHVTVSINGCDTYQDYSMDWWNAPYEGGIR